MSEAKELAERQRRYDQLHHLCRLQWLNAATPQWACGEPVSPSDRLKLRTQSERALLEPRSASRSVDLGDEIYLAELDDFAKAVAKVPA
jgi:hypothetical protein